MSYKTYLVQALSKYNKVLSDRVKSLENQVNTNSNNSSPSHHQMDLKRKLKD